MSPADKMKLALQISEQMRKLGFGGDTSKLDLGFVLPEDWPADMKDQPTMAHLVVVAHKLKMNIIISDIDLYPDKKRE